MTKRKHPNIQAKTTYWLSALFQVIQTFTSQNLQKKKEKKSVNNKKRNLQHLRKVKLNLLVNSRYSKSSKHVYKPKSTKKRREIRLMTKKRTLQHLRKRKMKLTGWSTLFQVV